MVKNFTEPTVQLYYLITNIISFHRTEAKVSKPQMLIKLDSMKNPGLGLGGAGALDRVY